MLRAPVTILAACACLAAPVAVETASMEERVRVAYAYDEASSSRDAEAVAAFYADDALFLSPTHDVVRGPDGLGNFVDGTFTAGVSG